MNPFDPPLTVKEQTAVSSCPLQQIIVAFVNVEVIQSQITHLNGLLHIHGQKDNAV